MWEAKTNGQIKNERKNGTFTILIDPENSGPEGNKSGRKEAGK